MDKKEKIDLLTLKDHDREMIRDIIASAGRIKADPGICRGLLSGKSIALLFNKHSTRTRLSFEAGINQMGGNTLYLDASSLQLSRGENYSDTARIFSGYIDGVVIRTYEQETLEIFSRNAGIPVINGLTDRYHPCQALADLFTVSELGILDKDLRFTYIGDSNNVTNSLMIGMSKLGIGITVCSPGDYGPDREILDYCSSLPGAAVEVVEDPVKAVKDADIIYTDVWISMGDKDTSGKIKRLKPYQVNSELLGAAKDGAKVMHCLPAHRGEEIAAEVMDGDSSIVFTQAENRLYAQKALLAYIYEQ
jgi:ornithine carbamoyltransferase